MCKCVTLAFLLAHDAVLLYIIAISTNYWFTSEAEAPRNQTTNVTFHKGLWQVCEEGKGCEYGAEYKYNTTEVQVYYRVSQFFYGFAGGNSAIALLFLYVAMMSKKLHDSVCLSGFISLLLGMSGLEGATALIVLGSELDDDQGFPVGYKNMFGWSYYVAIASVAVTFIAMLANVRHNCTMRSEIRHEGYERV